MSVKNEFEFMFQAKTRNRMIS